MAEVVEDLAVVRVDIEPGQREHRHEQAEHRQHPAGALLGFLIPVIGLVLVPEQRQLFFAHRLAGGGEDVAGGVADDLLRRLLASLGPRLLRRLGIDLE